MTFASAKKSTDENKPQWAKKDIRDYSEADLERLLDQWEASKSDMLLFRIMINVILTFRKMKIHLNLMSFPNT